MKKLTSLWVVIMLMTFLAISTIAQARTGDTSSSSSKNSTTSSSSSKSRGGTTGSRTSDSSSSSFSKPTTKTDSAFSNAAKTNQARIAWQERNKPVITPPLPNVAVPLPSPQDNKTEKQLADIQKQLEINNRNQKIIAGIQTAAQIAIANRNRTINTPVVTPKPTTIPTPVTTTPSPANVTNTAVTTPTPANKEGGTSWFTIILLLGGTVWLIFWFKKRATPITNYRL